MLHRILSRESVLLALFFAVAAPLCSAAIGPVTAIETDNPPGSPPYNIVSITVGGYTVTADRLATGTTTFGSTEGTPCPENDDFDINTALNWNLGQGPYFTVLFGSKLWKDSNGDAPDFFLFNSGGEAGDQPEMQAIFPDGSLGQMVKMPADWQGLGYSRVAALANDAVDMDGQSLEGISWAITDMLDASGNPLTNDTVIMGYQFTRSGTDPVGFFAVMPPAVQAQEPGPSNGATDVPREAVLGWTPAESAGAHDVYFGDVFADVNEATRTDPRSVLVSKDQMADTYTPRDRLEFGHVYYWRIDEVDASTGEIYKGEVWTFVTEPVGYPIEDVVATASSSTSADMGPEKTIDGSGLDDDDLHSTEGTAMWLSGAEPSGAWIEYAFDKVYKLHEMWVWNSNQLVESIPAFGFGIKEATVEYSVDGIAWTVLEGISEFAQAPGAEGYAPATVDLGGITARFVRITVRSSWGGQAQAGLSEVRFLAMPVQAREPRPTSGATDVDPSVVLNWRAGREAALHEVYLGADMGALPLVETVTENSYDTAALDLQLSARYYWQINEVNETETPASWEGDIWQFSTADFLVVDDFEAYTNDSPDRVFQRWIDGVGFSADEFFPVDEPGNGTGAALGHDIWSIGSPHYEQTIMETSIVHGGTHSAPLYYDGVSEIDRTFAVPQDWTRAGVTTLVLHFYGGPANAAGGQIYVKINGLKVPYDSAAGALARPRWTQWNVDLASVAGVNLQSVTALTVGVENGGSGLVYLDDILLYREAPAVAQEEIWVEAEATDTRGSLWTIGDDATASGGQYLGSEDGDGDDNSDPPDADWHATYKFSVAGGTYKLVARIITSPGNSFWVRIADATSPQITREDGWINTNPMDGGDTWHWDEIHNDEQNDNAVHFTLLAGEHTLEIAKREDGTLLDAIMITDKLD